MKKTLNKIILLGTVLLSFFLISCESTEDLFSFKDYVEEEITEDKEYLTTQIIYPKFMNLSKLNKEIKYSVENNWENFKKHAEDSWYKTSSLNQTSYYPPYQYIVDYKVSYSGDIVSVYLSTYTFSGGAHGNTSLKTINYDKKSNSNLNIVEATGYSYEELSDLCRKSLYNKFIKESKNDLDEEQVEILNEMREAGTEPYAGNFENFMVEGNKLTIYFEPYSVAPYYYGMPTVELPLKKKGF